MKPRNRSHHNSYLSGLQEIEEFVTLIHVSSHGLLAKRSQQIEREYFEEKLTKNTPELESN